jgi:sugar phosphate permease
VTMLNAIPNSTSSLMPIEASISAVLIGALSDQIGRKKAFILVGACAVVLLPLCYLGMAKASGIFEIALHASAGAFIGNTCYAPLLFFLNDRFPTATRGSGTGLSWNVGFALGGMTHTFVRENRRRRPSINQHVHVSSSLPFCRPPKCHQASAAIRCFAEVRNSWPGSLCAP